jgi:hypothetical protein
MIAAAPVHLRGRIMRPIRRWSFSAPTFLFAFFVHQIKEFYDCFACQLAISSLRSTLPDARNAHSIRVIRVGSSAG